MQPSPMAETSRLLLPSLRFCILKNRTSDSVLISQPSTNSLFWSFRLKGSHIDGETILHIGLQQSLVSFVDFLDWNNFDVGRDVMFAAKIEHLLRFGDTADRRAGEAVSAEDQAEGRNRERFLRCADEGDIAVPTKQIDIRVDVVIGGNGVEDEVEAAGVLFHLVGIAGDD